jgi:hypothetical protein
MKQLTPMVLDYRPSTKRIDYHTYIPDMPPSPPPSTIGDGQQQNEFLMDVPEPQPFTVPRDRQPVEYHTTPAPQIFTIGRDQPQIESWLLARHPNIEVRSLDETNFYV